MGFGDVIGNSENQGPMPEGPGPGEWWPPDEHSYDVTGVVDNRLRCWETYFWSFMLKNAGLVPRIRFHKKFGQVWNPLYSISDLVVIKYCRCFPEGETPEGSTTGVDIPPFPDLGWGAGEVISGWYVKSLWKCPAHGLGYMSCDGFWRYTDENLAPLEAYSPDALHDWAKIRIRRMIHSSGQDDKCQG